MDCTYKTNKYRQPLFEIVGMASIKLTFAVAFAYMESEQTKNFCWVFDKMKQLFIKQYSCPQVILTDRDFALMKAIETVFPKTTNLLCQFHINKNVKSKCKEHVVDDMRETVEKMWFELTRASDEMEYHQRLKQLEDACVDSKGHPSLSYFPMTSAQSPNASIYCIGFVNGNHWVQVNMNEGFSLPPVTTDWKKYRIKDATSWMVGFVGRLQNWQRHTPILPKYVRL
ncbi:protein FAR1-RELATED SEQUENCE 5-like [Vicia villosa]|uniref:protein FAR1-RELATED SEQUENCE 5-like n=1 Tax=Vicia villosa TaxID=3911 RepID=UPI00273B244A|nr:protein FAR1-RELATED SEQUENCE 5-like [Vicia villosa]